MPSACSNPDDVSNDSLKRRGRFDAIVIANRQVCREHFSLRLRIVGKFPATLPGQFIQIGCRPPAGGEQSALLSDVDLDWEPGQRLGLEQAELTAPLALLRRPFSLAGRGDDQQGTWIEIVHRVVGVGTQWLAQLQPGQSVDLLGPLGNHFALSPGKSLGLLVGGGVGLPPMFYLAQALRRAGWQATAFVGALSRELLAMTLPEVSTDAAADAASDAGIAESFAGSPSVSIANDACVTLSSVAEFAAHGVGTVITTNDGSLGIKGLITRGLEMYLQGLSPTDLARSVIFTCGPEPMMHAVAKLGSARGVECQVCLEQAMACGMGTCQSCVVKIEDRDRPQAHTPSPENRPWRYRLACTDGPVFDARQVIWGAGLVTSV